MRRHAHVSSAIVLVGLALACGGGGSGSGGGATADITADNAVAIASDVMDAILSTADLSTIGGGVAQDVFPTTALAAVAEDTPLLAFAAALSVAQARVEPLPSLPGGISASAVIDPTTQPCDAGGTVTISGSLAGSQPTAGDRINAVFLNCVDKDENGVPLPALNGGLAFTTQGFSGNLDSLFSLLLALTFDELTSGTGADRFMTDGSASTSFNNAAPPNVVSAVEGTNLRLERGDPAVPADLIQLNLNVFEAQLTQNTEDEDYEIEGDGQVSSSKFEGDVDYDVTTTLGGDIDENGARDLPKSGVVLVDGNASSMEIVVVDATTLNLVLDLDGDGVDDLTLVKTWTDLGF
ncbi:MAG TPA: hypothetical protein VFY49_20100 [Myxococcota bacterium]|nr:hypothetical protein [Myxococcota bacterium]